MMQKTNVKLKCNPPLGNLPALQWAMVSQLQVDASYQRSAESAGSQTLIRKIAQHWNWDLCQPLVVSRRADGGMFVIDGQHRLLAAKARGDVPQLPCVVVDYASPAAEAASFVQLNQLRRPLTKLEVFHAAVAGEDPEALAIVAAMSAVGIMLAPHSNYISWKPGMVSNIGGIEAAWRQHGEAITGSALLVLSKAWPGKVLQYAGSVFPGIVEMVAEDVPLDRLLKLLGTASQVEWRNRMMRVRGENPNLKYGLAMATAMRKALGDEPMAAPIARAPSPPAPAPVRSPTPRPAPAPEPVDLRPEPDGKVWCDQCDKRVPRSKAESCGSTHCSLRRAAPDRKAMLGLTRNLTLGRTG